MITVEKAVVDMIFYNLYDDEKTRSPEDLAKEAELFKKCDEFVKQLPSEVNAELKARAIFCAGPWSKEEAEAFIAKHQLKVI